jgi:hypothetical protein
VGVVVRRNACGALRFPMRVLPVAVSVDWQRPHAVLAPVVSRRPVVLVPRESHLQTFAAAAADDGSSDDGSLVSVRAVMTERWCWWCGGLMR